MIYIGIDPGKSGGMVTLGTGWLENPGGYRTKILTKRDKVSLCPMPETEGEIWHWFSEVSQTEGPHVAVLEQVGGVMGGEDNKFLGAAMFKFGEGYGFLKGMLRAFSIPYELVTPQRWQKQYSLSRKKGEKKGPWKNRIREVACRLFPQEKVTLATCDALLIAEYCRRKHTGTLER